MMPEDDTHETVSVIIPVYNAGRYLRETIESVLRQTRPPAEIILIDDGSSDDSPAIAASFGKAVRWLEQAHQGQAIARNLGIRTTTGSLLAFLDADDLWAANRLEVQLSLLQARPELEAVTGGVENFISPELNEAERKPLALAARQSGQIHVGALLIRRESFLRVGWFDPRWRYTDFIEWWSRAMRLGLNYESVAQVVLRRRLHQSNLTRNNGMQQEMLALLREELARKRATGEQQ
jgi:glycosyltransferase involved in cell wall biosynthesis